MCLRVLVVSFRQPAVTSTAFALALSIASAPLLTGCSEASKKENVTARLLSEVDDVSPDVRLRAVAQLGLARERAAVVPLIERIADIRLDVRKAAVQALGAVGDARAVGPLSRVLEDKSADGELRRLAADALGAIGDAGAVPSLSRVLRSSGAEGEAGLAGTCAHALSGIGEPAEGALTGALADGSPEARRAAASALGRIGTERSRKVLASLLDDPDPLIRLSAAEGLSRLGDASAAPEIALLLLDPDETVRLGVPRALKRLGLPVAASLAAVFEEGGLGGNGDASRARTVGSAREGRPPGATGPRAGPRRASTSLPAARRAAVDVLTSLSGVPVVRPLVLAASAPEGDVASEARSHLLAQLDDPASRAELLRISTDGADDERQTAIAVLGDFLDARLRRVARGSHDRTAALREAGLGDLTRAVEVFARAVEGGPSPLRFQAALSLCALGDARGRPVVEEALDRAASALKAQVVEAKKEAADQETVRRLTTCLGVLAPVADAALASKVAPLLAIRHRDWRAVARGVVPIIGRSRDARFIDVLLPFLAIEGRPEHGEGSVEALAMKALGAIGDGRAFDPILKHLKVYGDHHWWTPNRTVGLRSLIQCDRDRAYEVVGGVLLETRAHDIIQIAAISAILRDLPDRRAVMPLVHWVNHDIQRAQDAVREALTAIGRTDIRWLIEAFEVEGHARRSALAGLVAEASERKDLPAVLAAARDERPRVRQGAVWALGCIGGVEARTAVLASLGDGHAGVRSAAVWSAGRLGDASFVEPVLKALGDADPTVRAMAAEQLAAFGDARAVEPLVSALEDETPEVRACAALSLGKLAAPGRTGDGRAKIEDGRAVAVFRLPSSVLGPASPAGALESALPPLLALEGDADPNVRAAAKYAVAAIRGSRGAGAGAGTAPRSASGVPRPQER